ncbi:hypothetical protein LPJ64_000330 [Coemansia asiatica]|uniref:Kinesin motor domain-containing protein n=1 Tax=Coemansia asiatica TaxID=1052880 RepID=A0A9W7XR41_9FUNG|nr:hypothetical protein LPJ64_000330 [Coemansia asiatica]
MDDHINVAIRVRPLNQREQRSSTAASTSQQLPWAVQKDTITQRITTTDSRVVNGNSFTFDKVFDQKDTTQKVYDEIVKGIITSSMSGFNGTIFAYGQTSSGKTHTMYGSGPEDGIIKLAVKNMFSFVEGDPKREYLIRVSFLEIYNEVLRDLLEPTKTNLKIHENTKHEIFVGDLSEHIVFNAEQVEEILAKGDSNRQIGGTNMNERSSRSHTIFRIVVESRDKSEITDDSGALGDADSLARRQQRLSTGSAQETNEFTGAVMVSCLNLVDLAGSERVGQTGAEGQRLKEGAHINKSLLSLGTVIARLSEDGGDRGHIPYRDSKITRILQPSLGGNAKTLIICTITPSPDYVDETLSTLKFASRAKTIKNKPEVNEELRGDALLRRLKRASELEKEIAQMKEIEQKKLKIEADNESLLRQLWKSQKERDRLQRELVKQQANMFLPRQAESKDSAVDLASVVRRQTWFPGLQAPFVDDGSSSDAFQQTSFSPAPITEFGIDTMAMDMDTNAANLISKPLDQKADSNAIAKEVHQAALEQINELRLKSVSMQQEYEEIIKSNKEMERTIQRYMREYSLLLSTLNQLAAAEIIPPSPAKPSIASLSEQQPRELVQIRRKLRALMTTIDASQRMCQKFRSQRPEAEFLEMELQATRETLLQKEEELVEILRESDELFSKFRETESELTESQTACEQLRVDLDSAGLAQERIERARQELTSLLEQERQQFSAQLQAQTVDFEQRASDAEQSFNLKMTLLESKVSRTTEELETFRSRHASREQELLSELEFARATLSSSQLSLSSLESQLSEATAQLDKYKDRCESLELSNAVVTERDLEITQLKSLVAELQIQSSDYTLTINDLRDLVTKHESCISDKDRETEQLREEISKTAAAMAAMELKIADADSAHRTEIQSYEASLSSLREASADEKSILEQKVAELISCIDSLRAEISAIGDKLALTEKELVTAVEDLGFSKQQASQLAGLTADKHRLSDELALLQTSYDKLSAGMEGKQKELGVAVEEREHLLTKISELESQNADVWDRISELTVSNNDLTTDLAEFKKSISDKDMQISSLENSIAESTTQNATLKQEMDQLIKSHSTALAQVESTNLDIEQKLELAKKQFGEDENKWRAEISSLNSQLTASSQKLQAVIDEYEQKIQHLSTCESIANDRIKQLEASLQSTQTQLTSLRQDLENTDASKSNTAELNAELSRQLEAKSVFVSELELQLETSQGFLEKAQKEHEQIVSNLRSQIDELNSRFAAEQDKLQSDIAVVDETRNMLQAQLDELTAKYSDTCRLLSEAEKECDKAQADLEREKELAQSMSLSADRFAKQFDEIQLRHSDQVSQLQAQIDSLALDKEHAEHKSVEVQEMLNSASDELSRLKSALSDAESRYSDLEKEQVLMKFNQTDLQSRLEAKCAGIDASNKLLSEQTQLNESFMAQITQLQSSNDKRQDRILELEIDVQSLTDSRDAANDQAKSLAQSIEQEIVALRQTIAEQLAKISATQQELSDATIAREQAQARISELQSELEAVSKTESGSCTRLAQLDTELIEQQELASSLREQLGQLKDQLVQTQNKNSERNAELQENIGILNGQISDKQSEIICLENKLNHALQDADALRKAYEKSQAEYDSLVEQTKESQKRLEQELSEAKHELSRKAVTIGDLESALEAANSVVSVSQTKAQEEALATIEGLRKQMAISENKLSETKMEFGGSRLAVEKLEQERDRAVADIETLKHMMVELASSKDKEIVDLEELLKQREELLEASVRETVEKEEAIQLAEKLAATHLDRAVKAESELEKEAKSNAEAIERLAKERLELEKRLEGARLLETELREKQSGAKTEMSRLQLEIEQHEQAESDLEKSLEHMSDDLAKAQEEASLAAKKASDQIISMVNKDLVEIVSKLSALPSCKSVEVPDAAINDTATFGHKALFAIAHDLVSAALSSLSSLSAQGNGPSISSLELDEMRSEIDRLRKLNEKLEKKNAKLLDVYKADVTGLHEQEEKHRKRAEELAAELGENASKMRAMEGQLAEVKDELEKQQKQRFELEATIVQLTTKAAIAVHKTRTAETPTTPMKQVSSRPSTPDTGNRNGSSAQTPSHAKSAMARLASQRTPMKSENKRVHAMSKPETMLSPVSSSVLNARLAASSAQDDAQQVGRYSLRKRTVSNSENSGVSSVAVTVAAATVTATTAGATAESAAVAKTEAMRTRSTYGDRRRNRRNQPAVRNDGLDEQAAEQCAQQ